MSARFESLCRPNTPVPTASPAGRGGGGPDPAGGGISPTTSRGPPREQQQQDCGGADLGAPSSWGFLPSADCVAAEARAGDDAAVGGGGGGASAAEVAALREENASLKKELRRARAEIKRLTRGDGGGDSGGRQAPDGIGNGGGIATSASTGALEENRKGLDGGVTGDAQHGEEGGRKGGKSRTPRESRSRKKIDIDTARATDAVVEAAAAGSGLASPATPEPGLSSEVGTREMLT